MRYDKVNNRLYIGNNFFPVLLFVLFVMYFSYNIWHQYSHPEDYSSNSYDESMYDTDDPWGNY